MTDDRDPAHLSPDIQPLCAQFLEQCAAAGIDAFITQTYRSAADQDADYEQGRTTPGSIITNARGGQSKHNCVAADGSPASQAFDFGIKNGDGSLDWNAQDAQWQKAIAIGIGLGFVSGSCWKTLRDCPHMELPSGSVAV